MGDDQHPRVGNPPERRGDRRPVVPHNVPVRGHRDRSSGLRWALLSVATTCTAIAWGLLVVAAIDFGAKARGGEPGNWWFVALATIGAMACMFLSILLAIRLHSEIRGQGAPRGTTSSGGKHGGKRAAR